MTGRKSAFTGAALRTHPESPRGRHGHLHRSAGQSAHSRRAGLDRERRHQGGHGIHEFPDLHPDNWNTPQTVTLTAWMAETPTTRRWASVTPSTAREPQTPTCARVPHRQDARQRPAGYVLRVSGKEGEEGTLPEPEDRASSRPRPSRRTVLNDRQSVDGKSRRVVGIEVVGVWLQAAVVLAVAAGVSPHSPAKPGRFTERVASQLSSVGGFR